MTKINRIKINVMFNIVLRLSITKVYEILGLSSLILSVINV